MELIGTPLVSILMPVKNAAPFIRDCLDSILTQSFTSWELIAVDDHSTDQSINIIEDYSKNDQRINLLHNDGVGIISALRMAYSNSSGTFMTRMDADDIMTPHKLSVLYKNLENCEHGHLSIGQVKYISDDNLGDGYKRYETWLNRLTSTGSNFEELYRECAIPSPCWMLHRDDLDQIGAFDSDIYPEDYDLAFRMYQGGLKCIPCQEQIHLWRDHAKRSSRTQDHYADNRFLSLKCHHFIHQDYQASRPLLVWGAGRKGKDIVKILLEADIELHWICDNSNKWGHNIFGLELHPISYLNQLDNPLIIVAVSNQKEAMNIELHLKKMGLKTMCDFFFFC